MNMITNLFSSFDPTSNWSIPLNWLGAVVFMVVVTPIFWKIPSKKNIIVLSLLKKLHNEFSVLIGNVNKQGLTLIFLALFLFIIINNFLGLFPYIFTSSRHLTLTLGLALPLWISFIIFGWLKNTTHMLAHLVPNGTPNLLIPFIVLIESIRNIIRPITLSVRLIANIVAGHLLITLLGNQTAMARNFILIGLIFTQIILLTLERAVAVIQSYVFAVLSTLYSREVN